MHFLSTENWSQVHIRGSRCRCLFITMVQPIAWLPAQWYEKTWYLISGVVTMCMFLIYAYMLNYCYRLLRFCAWKYWWNSEQDIGVHFACECFWAVWPECCCKGGCILPQTKEEARQDAFFIFCRPKQRAAFSTTRGACFFVQGCIKHGLGVQHASFLSARSQSTGRDASHGSFGWNSQTFTTTGFIQWTEGFSLSKWFQRYDRWLVIHAV